MAAASQPTAAAEGSAVVGALPDQDCPLVRVHIEQEHPEAAAGQGDARGTGHCAYPCPGAEVAAGPGAGDPLAVELVAGGVYSGSAQRAVAGHSSSVVEIGLAAAVEPGLVETGYPRHPVQYLHLDIRQAGAASLGCDESG